MDQSPESVAAKVSPTEASTNFLRRTADVLTRNPGRTAIAAIPFALGVGLTLIGGAETVVGIGMGMQQGFGPVDFSKALAEYPTGEVLQGIGIMGGAAAMFKGAGKVLRG